MEEPKYTVSLTKDRPMVIVKANSVRELESALEALERSEVPRLLSGLQGRIFPQAPTTLQQTL